MILVWVLIAGLILIATFVLAGAGPWNSYLARRHMAGRPRLDSREFAIQFYPESPEVASTVRDLLQEYIKVDLSQMQPSDQPVRDLYLGAIYGGETDDVVVAIERCFDIQIEDEVAEKMRTVDDLIRYVISKVEKKQ